jgi:hypothetical protein
MASGTHGAFGDGVLGHGIIGWRANFAQDRGLIAEITKSSAVDLKFLSVVRRTRVGTSNPKTALES